jgi:hypothetical protein
MKANNELFGTARCYIIAKKECTDKADQFVLRFWNGGKIRKK